MTKRFSFSLRRLSQLSRRTQRRLLAGSSVLLAALAVFSAWKLADIRARNAASQRAFDQLLPASNGSTAAFGSDPASRPDDEPADAFAALFDEYPDMVAWLSIDDTKLQYPVMQTPDSPNYYLRRNLQGEYDFYGVPYLNEACSLQDSDNLIIYGHSLDNGDVFGTLLEYSSADYCRQHPVISLQTREGLRQYTVLGAFITDVTPETGDSFAYNDFINAADEAAYNAYIQNVRARAYYQTDTDAAYGTQLLTLSTCEYTLPDGRFVLVAVRTA